MQHATKACVVSLLAVLLSASFRIGAQNLITNGGFEIGTGAPAVLTTGSTAIAGWIVTGNSVDYANQWITPQGTKYVDLSGAAPGGVEQSVTTVPGGFYTLKFIMAGNPSIPTRTMRVTAAASWQEYSFDASLATGLQMGWVERTFVFRAIGSSTLVNFSAVSPTQWGVIIDDVRLFYTPYVVFGQGCAWSGGLPQLDASLPPRIGQPFGLILTNLPASQPGAVIWGYSTYPAPMSLSAAGMPGCNLYSPPDVVLPFITGSFGAHVWGDVLPNNPALVGFHFYNQAFVAAPGANALGVVMTNSGAGIVGS